MACIPLTPPPEWQAVVSRSFLLGVPVIGPQVRVYESLCAQLAQRGPECWQAWGATPERVALAQFTSAALAEACAWPNCYFVPEDPLALVCFNHRATAIDGLEVYGALRAVERHVDRALSNSAWEALIRGSFGALIDSLLEGGHHGGA